MVKFAIVGVRRSGTKLIATNLDSHPDIKCINEAFVVGGRLFRPRGVDFAHNYRSWYTASLTRRVKDLVMRPSCVAEYLDDLYSQDKFQAIGFKLMEKEHRKFPTVLDYLRRNNASIIQVTRKNELKTLVSRSVKRVNNVAHTTRSVERVQVTLQEEKLISRLTSIARANERMEEAVAGMPYLRVYYEDFIEHKDREVERMLNFLSVDASRQLHSDLIKGNPDSLRNIISNYEAVAGILKGTEFEWCLD